MSVHILGVPTSVQMDGISLLLHAQGGEQREGVTSFLRRIGLCHSLLGTKSSIANFNGSRSWRCGATEKPSHRGPIVSAGRIPRMNYMHYGPRRLDVVA